MSTTKLKIQNILLLYNADANFRGYRDLMHKNSSLIYDPEEKCHILKKYDHITFTTYFNALQMARWKKYTFAEKFSLRLEFKGRAAIGIEEIYRNSKNVDCGVLKQLVIESKEKTVIDIEIPDSDKTLVGFTVSALEEFTLYSGSYIAEVDETCVKDIYISLASTTFKKEDYIKKNIKILKETVLSADSEMKDHFFVNIVDNGRTLDPKEINDTNIKVHPNMNVGGAGGFTRGIIESLDLPKKPTHVLLMDDDVLIMGESLFRTYYLLRITKPEYDDCFVSGAMFDYDQRQIQYEDIGYVHPEDASYGPLKERMDMMVLENLLKNEEWVDIEKANSYAGWWYCCIPVTKIEENGLPLPVFIRGDDVEYSIRNNARFLTVNGISIWHVGFAGKFNAAMELYQVHRNSLIIQAASDICKDIDFIERLKSLFWKDITRFAYSNAEQILDSIDDFMKGPEFLKSANGEAIIKEHGAKNEKLVPIGELPAPLNAVADPYEYVRLNKLQKLIYVFTINGHLLPGILLKKRPAVIAYDWFFVPGKNYMRKNLVAFNPNDSTACIRKISRKRCFALIKRYMKVMTNYKKNHVAVEQAYRNNFGNMVSTDFWKEYLGI